MADDLGTLREVGHGFDGLRLVLDIYGAVFAGVCTAALAGGWFMFSKVDRVEGGIARIDVRVRLTQVDETPKTLATTLGEIQAWLRKDEAQTRKPSSGVNGQTDGSATGAVPN